MFDSVLREDAGPKSRFGTGTVLSVGLHLALVGLVFWAARSSARKDVKQPPELRFFAPLRTASSPAAPLALAGAPTATPVPKKVEKRPVLQPATLVQPVATPETPPPEPETPPQPESPTPPTETAGPDGPGLPGGSENGTPGGSLDGQEGAAPGGSNQGSGAGPDVLPFGDGMTRPVVDKEALARNLYTREALEAGVAGKMKVKCHVLADGSIRRCRVLKSLPHLSEAVVKRLESMRATPTMFQGEAIAIDFIFTFDFQMP
jgi:protein TonB